MGNLFEIVFEDISINVVGSCLKELTQNGSMVSNYNISSDEKSEVVINFIEDDEIKNILKNHQGEALIINLHKLELESIEVFNSSIRLINYDDKYDIEINFDLVDISTDNNELLLNELRKFSLDIANNYKINNYYAGYEPAYDEENRVYTNNKIGPLNIT